MKLEGKKTKIGSIGFIITGFLFWAVCLGLPIEISYGSFSISLGIVFWGLYDRTVKINKHQIEKLEEIRGKIKKPVIMS